MTRRSDLDGILCAGAVWFSLVAACLAWLP
jgi:hypothetical protein